MDFAPYQSSPPEHARSPVESPRTSLERRPWSPGFRSGGAGNHAPSGPSPPPLQHPQPQRQWSGGMPSPTYYQQALGSGVLSSSPSGGGARAGGGGGHGNRDGYFPATGGGSWADREGTMSEFDTSLGIRLDYEACMAYLVCPPLGAILLLILERKSDYVRFHAWQSSLLFTAVFIAHLILSWSKFLSWVLFLGDLALIAFLTLKAYRDADTLDRFELPIVGPLASRFLDDE